MCKHMLILWNWNNVKVFSDVLVHLEIERIRKMFCNLQTFMYFFSRICFIYIVTSVEKNALTYATKINVKTNWPS